MLFISIYNGLATGLAIVFMGNGVKFLMQEWQLDRQFIHFTLIMLNPLLFVVSLFFTLQIFQNVSMAMGPIAQYFKNLCYYSAILHVLPAFNAHISSPHHYAYHLLLACMCNISSHMLFSSSTPHIPQLYHYVFHLLDSATACYPPQEQVCIPPDHL
ncbi:hypothetical protein EDC04DRAFT_2897053 [Pisolithus marmoratus]|nr:hypothetical protein EDC04DRAFT_2897053 [Pisolithus marmoratus]